MSQELASDLLDFLPRYAAVGSPDGYLNQVVELDLHGRVQSSEFPATPIVEAIESPADSVVFSVEDVDSMRRKATNTATISLASGRIIIRGLDSSVSVDDKAAHLTASEYRLLRYLALAEGRVRTSFELTQFGVYGSTRASISRIREKLSQMAGNTEVIETTVGLGYRVPSAQIVPPELDDSLGLSVTGYQESVKQIELPPAYDPGQRRLVLPSATLLTALDTVPGFISEKAVNIHLTDTGLSRAIEARATRLEPTYLADRRLCVDEAEYEVILDGRVLDLQIKEFAVLSFFSQNPDRLITKNELVDALWGGYTSDASLKVYISRLRTKFGRGTELADSDKGIIRTVRGLGYIAVSSLNSGEA